MHDAGTVVNMVYGCATTGGSAATGDEVPGALKNVFGFASADYASYGSGSYLNVVSNLNDDEPVLLSGCNDENKGFLGLWYTYEDCHEWVCDGYQETYFFFCSNGQEVGDSYLYFHMNWGWHEINSNVDYNGWFAFDNWTITGAGPNGSNENFQYAQYMTTNIYP